MKRLTQLLAVVVAAAILAGCGADGTREIDSTPTKLDGTESHEFEQEDIDAAAGASDAVKAYCGDAAPVDAIEPLHHGHEAAVKARLMAHRD
jgi:hypothetical protein